MFGTDHPLALLTPYCPVTTKSLLQDSLGSLQVSPREEPCQDQVLKGHVLRC